MARVRSPNYPQLSLPEALDRVRKIHAKEQHLAATRDVIASHLGYGGMNGASAKAISAIAKYGLLEDAGPDKMRVSPLALSIIFPRDGQEKAQAIRRAAFNPSLFSDIAAEWEGHQPSDANLRSFLIRRNFSSDALDRVIASYKETMTLVTQESGAYDSPEPTAPVEPEKPSMQPAVAAAAPPAPSFAISSGADHYRLGFSPSGGLEGGFRISNLHELDDFIRALTGLKVLLKPVSEIKPPQGQSDDAH